MSVYSISSIEVKDWEAYKEYMKLVPDVIHKFGGKYFRDSEEYKPVAAIRLKASTSEGFVVEGI